MTKTKLCIQAGLARQASRNSAVSAKAPYLFCRIDFGEGLKVFAITESLPGIRF